jgi:hypothetical protein
MTERGQNWTKEAVVAISLAHIGFAQMLAKPEYGLY